MTPPNQEWRAYATYTRPTDLTDDQTEALVRAVPGFGLALDDGTHLNIEMTINAGTLRQAMDAALRAARAAWAEVFGRTTDPLALRVAAAALVQAEAEHPAPDDDLIGTAEAAEILNVATARIRQLDNTPDFPAAVARPAMGPIYTRSAIEAFKARWDRRPGRRPKTSST
jgi:hypothetical protein